MIQDYYYFFKRSWPLLIFGMLTVFWGNFGQSFFISWYGASFQQSLNLSATSYGTIYSGATLASGLLLMWIGGAVDKTPLPIFVTIIASGLCAAALMLWQVASVEGLVLSIFMLRFFGQGLLPHTGITTMTREFATNRGKAVSIASSGVPLGEIILPTVALFLISRLGWQQSWLVVALSVPLLFLPFSLWLLRRAKHIKQYKDKNLQEDFRVSQEPDGSRKTMLKDQRFWLALPTILAAPFIITGVFIHQGFFLPELHWSPRLFANSFIFYGVSHWLAALYSGALVDRFSGVQLFKFFPLPMLLGLCTPLVITGDWGAYLFLIFLGASIGSGNPIINSLWAEVYGTTNLGAIRAMVSSFAVISTSVSPILFGLFIDHGMSGKTLLAWLAGYLFIAILLSFFTYRTSD